MYVKESWLKYTVVPEENPSIFWKYEEMHYPNFTQGTLSVNSQLYSGSDMHYPESVQGAEESEWGKYVVIIMIS